MGENKSEWTADMPYPVWPFGTVNPKELAKWMEKLKEQEFEPALF